MNDEEYNKSYYERNRDQISKRRKERYRTEPKYRATYLRRARERFKKRLKSPDKKTGYTVKKIDGNLLYTMKYAATMMAKCQDFVRMWERKGFIPKSTFTDTRGWRLYTTHQIKLLSRAVRQYDNKEWNKQEFRDYLFTHWELLEETKDGED